MKTSVGIIGLGNIGMGYDKSLEDENYLTHSKSFYLHPDFEISFLLDTNEDLCIKARERFSDVHVVNSVDDVKEVPDVLVLAANPAVNAQYINRFKDNKTIKFFVVEKPVLEEFISSLSEEEFANLDDRVYVNYVRKYLPFFQDIREEISSGTYGNCHLINVSYSKGLRNNGSHLLDLIHSLFPGKDLLPETVFRSVEDHTPIDPSLSFVLKIQNEEKTPVVFNALNEKDYSVIEMDLFFEKKRLRLYDFCETFDSFSIKDDEMFSGYKNLLPDEEKKSTNLSQYGYFLCDKIKAILTSDSSNDSGLSNEKFIIETIEKIKK